MNIDILKLEQKINELPEICEGGKTKIKEIFEEALGIKFKKDLVLELGRVYSLCGNLYILASVIRNKYGFFNLRTGCTWNDPVSLKDWKLKLPSSTVLVANSVQDLTQDDWKRTIY